ncbi:ABC transporter ATP-binding protein [Actinotalea sp. BY-33]|uniref:ABC transporter ATP-binding protein n=1 Tax=Actinotalea soli TaxID=2819234 RepID=A0A939RUY3_9CELL|nr:ABC transporter ATP-binding protein [Actinotalea soli]MBO1751088.1 ABC transporter ATP-binding protein [Actinotalea soli]
MTSATAPPHVVEVEHVTRRFDATVALDDVSLTVRRGELLGLLGPNGAGKTTLLSLINGLRKPDSGTIRLFGGDPRDPASRARLGTTPQETGLPPTLRVAEVVDFVARHYPDPMPTAEVLEMFGLTDLARRQTGGLSGGQKRRLAIGLALTGRPELVLLDEPTTGLDVDARHALWDALRSYHAQGGTIVLTSHYLEEVQALAQRVVVVDRGQVLADDRLDVILDRVALRRMSLRVPDAAVSSLATVPGLTQHETSADGRHELLVSDADAAVRALVAADVPFEGLTIAGATLEEAFLTMTRTPPGATQPGATQQAAAVDQARSTVTTEGARP